MFVLLNIGKKVYIGQYTLCTMSFMYYLQQYVLAWSGLENSLIHLFPMKIYV